MAARSVYVEGLGVVPAMSISYDLNRGTITEDAFNRATQTKIYGGTFSATGSISAAYRPSKLSTLTNYVLGNDNGTINTDGDYIGNATDCDNGKYILINDDYTDGYYKFEKCMFNSMELTLNANEYAKVTYNWTGRLMSSVGSAITPEPTAYDDEIPVFYNAVVDFGGAIKAKGITIKIDRPITPQFAIGSEYARKFSQSGQLAVTGTITLAASEHAQLLVAGDTDDQLIPDIDASSSAHVNKLANGTLTVTLQDYTGTSTLQTITISGVKITSSSLSMQGRNPEDKKLEWAAEIDADSDVEFSAEA